MSTWNSLVKWRLRSRRPKLLSWEKAFVSCYKLFFQKLTFFSKTVVELSCICFGLWIGGWHNVAIGSCCFISWVVVESAQKSKSTVVVSTTIKNRTIIKLPIRSDSCIREEGRKSPFGVLAEWIISIVVTVEFSLKLDIFILVDWWAYCMDFAVIFR